MKGASLHHPPSPFLSFLLPPLLTHPITYALCACVLAIFYHLISHSNVSHPSQHQKDAKRITHTVKVIPCHPPLLLPVHHSPPPLWQADCVRSLASLDPALALCVCCHFSFCAASPRPPKFVYVEKSNIPSRTRIITIRRRSRSKSSLGSTINFADPAIRPSGKRAQLLKRAPYRGQDQGPSIKTLSCPRGVAPCLLVAATAAVDWFGSLCVYSKSFCDC